MRHRCMSKCMHNYSSYGGRGIKVCERWEKFENFLEDMGHPPKGMTLDRIDTNGNYEPINCQWANSWHQRRNTNRNRFITYRGETLCMADWAKKLSMKSSLLRYYFFERNKTMESIVQKQNEKELWLV